MTCVTDNFFAIQRTVAEWLRVGQDKQCLNCRQPLTLQSMTIEGEFEGYRHSCGELVCIICGCTENHACEGGCSWAGPGICSTHIEELNQRMEAI